MPPPTILDPATLDFSKVLADREGIMQLLPHRFEFQLLDAVLFADLETRTFAGYSDLREDAWWARGHIPGRPLFPGVLMVEMGAQLMCYFCYRVLGQSEFIGFTGIDGVRFRGAVVPPARLTVVGRQVELKRRRLIADVQGFVDQTMVFEGRLTGMPI